MNELCVSEVWQPGRGREFSNKGFLPELEQLAGQGMIWEWTGGSGTH